jgi:hypothetical protein
VIGALEGGFDVVGVERDPRQYAALAIHCQTFKQTKKEAKETEKKLASLEVPMEECHCCGLANDLRALPLKFCSVCERIVCNGCARAVDDLVICTHEDCTINGKKWKAKGMKKLITSHEVGSGAGGAQGDKDKASK